MVMGHTSRTSRKDPAHPLRRPVRLVCRIGAGLPFLLLIAAVAVTMAAVGIASQNMPITAASGTGRGTSTPVTRINPLNLQHTCGFQGEPTCPTNQQQWIPLHSTNPGDIIASARASRLFNINAAGNGDTPSLSHLGTPQLVLAFHAGAATSTSGGPDYYLVPIQETAGATLGVVLCQVNAGRTAISVVAIVQYAQPRPAGLVTRMSAQQAIAAMQTRQHVALHASAAPQLIYFPGSAMAQEAGKLTWVSGGESPDDPVWMIPGADGQQHIVGSDGQVYYVNQLPSALQSPSAG